MKKPYIKKFSEVAGFKIFIVDGQYIRENIDEEFTNYGQHYQFKFVPKNEFWIDKERTPGEEGYFIDSMLTIERLLSKKVKLDSAIKSADRKEKSERAKSILMRKEIKLEKYPKKLIDSIHKKLLKKYSTDKLKVWIIKGEVVRDLFFLDFTEGGHGYVYPFIPKDEIWIDDDLEPDEVKFVLLHEMHERNLMEKGWGYANDRNTAESLRKAFRHAKIKKSAHYDAARLEFACRRKKKDINKELRIEVEKNNK